MKITPLFFYLFCCTFMVLAQNKIPFDNFFHNKTMRIDFYHSGNSSNELISLDLVYVYGEWAGSLGIPFVSPDLGRYVAKLTDKKSGQLIFSKHFDSYFGEYKTSTPAAQGIWRTYHESVLTPLPRDSVIFSLERRNKDQSTEPVFEYVIDPADVSIIHREPSDEGVIIIEVLRNGDPQTKVDLVFLGEGYTKQQTDKFRSDLNRFTNILFNAEPFRSEKDKFNVYGVLKPSIDSGVSEPRAGYFKNTALGATFNSLGSERYLLTENNRTVRDLAAFAPYDAICIMVNHHRYGGGGIYNLFCTFTTDNQWSDYLLVHEFGHSFAGLADEYYTSETAYSDFYPQDTEPLEKNITALHDKNNVKWKNSLTRDVQIPTPWEKEDFDKMDLKWQEERRQLNDQIARLKKSRADQQEIAKAEQLYDQKDKEHARIVSEYMRGSRFYGQVGAFEGAGYVSRGLYRPMLDCIMFSKGNKPFCVVCRAAISEMISWYAR